jgi:hypothetical protein
LSRGRSGCSPRCKLAEQSSRGEETGRCAWRRRRWAAKEMGAGRRHSEPAAGAAGSSRLQSPTGPAPLRRLPRAVRARTQTPIGNPTIAFARLPSAVNHPITPHFATPAVARPRIAAQRGPWASNAGRCPCRLFRHFSSYTTLQGLPVAQMPAQRTASLTLPNPP